MIACVTHRNAFPPAIPLRFESLSHLYRAIPIARSLVHSLRHNCRMKSRAAPALISLSLFAATLCLYPSLASASLSLDGHSNAQFSGTNSGTITLTTSDSDDVIVLLEYNENTSSTTFATISSISDTVGLHWALRTATTTSALTSFYEPNAASDQEVWYATSSAPLSSDTITVNLNNTTDDESMVAFGVNGVNLSAPWDTNSSLPVESFDVGGIPGSTPSCPCAIPAVSGVYTNEPDEMLLGLVGNGTGGYNYGAGTPYTPGTGFTFIDAAPNNGGTNASDAEAEYETVNSQQSNATIAWGESDSNWLMMGDALVAASQPATGRIIRIVGGTRLVGGVRLE